MSAGSFVLVEIASEFNGTFGPNSILFKSGVLAVFSPATGVILKLIFAGAFDVVVFV